MLSNTVGQSLVKAQRLVASRVGARAFAAALPNPDYKPTSLYACSDSEQMLRDAGTTRL